ncbi:lysozyme [Arachidicoccus rhizosphaerae]|jgi:lysozyme|uniref:Lysozyme n=1 Tax=Arachidicoccus rhizosphaerae TaxID=551991 RepID=A0A1H4C4Q5_9BACT|nr:GH25 family lysozyme [Arachidicoccus rhizosphaerae]SEA55356.1 lysozyme [Arachidicoccus rhizosphaerae]
MATGNKQTGQKNNTSRSVNKKRPKTGAAAKSGTGRFWKILGWTTLGLFVFSVLLYIYNVRRNKDTYFAHYKEFGIDLPTGYEIHGIDVSHHQGKINWPMVKSMESENVRIGFVFIKATEGYQLVDKSFTDNWFQAGLLAIPRGAYHFFIPGKSGALQAANFIRHVPREQSTLPPVIDIEQRYNVAPSLFRKELQVMLDSLEHYYKQRPIIYTYASFYNDYLDGHFDNYPLWVAHYFELKRPRTDRDWLFWQHSEQGHVYGIKKLVDFNVFTGDSSDFRKLLRKTDTP